MFRAAKNRPGEIFDGNLRQFTDGRVLSRAVAVSNAMKNMYAENMLSAFFRGESTAELYNSSR